MRKSKLLALGLGPITDYPKNKSVVDVFEKIAEKYPKHTALQFQEDSLCYEELNAKANQLACYLQKLGVKKQDYVGIYLHRSIDLFVGILGILKAGAIYVPIDASYPKQRKLFMIQDTGLKILLTERKFATLFPQQLHIVFLKEVNLSSYSSKNQRIKIKPLDLAYVNYTSGTTGNPKGVLIAHRSINRLVVNPNWIDFNNNDRFLQISNISFDALVHELWGALLNGANLCIYPQISITPEDLGKFIQEKKITQAIFTARLFNLMVDEALHFLKGMKAICSVGDVMSAKHAKIAFEHLPNCRIINACGHTENTTHTTAYTILNTGEIEHSVPIGRPIGNTSVYILNEQKKLVPFGESGELYTGGDGVARGYLNLPDLTRVKFIANPFGKGHLYRTGDLVRYLPDGNLSFLGRLDTQVKIRGFRIELGELEDVVRSFPQVSDCVAMAIKDPKGEKHLVVYAEAKNQKPTSEELRNWIESQLPSFASPHFIIVLEAFPMTPNGKIDRKQLPPVFEEEKKEAIFHSKTEEIVVRVVSKVLHRKSVGCNDHLFKIGGDSIHAMQIASELKRIFKKEISAALLFEYPIISDLVNVIDSLGKMSSSSIRKHKKSIAPLSYSQESLWLTCQLNPHAKLQYVVFYAYQVKGPLQISKLQNSLKQIIDRHEILRTCFIEKEGEIKQLIQPHSDHFFLKFSSISEQQALRLLQKKMSQEMDLTRLPLLQAIVIQVKPNLSFLGIRVHHIIFDLLSFKNFFREWTSLYASEELSSLQFQYSDYTLWQKKQLEKPESTHQLAFWKDYLKGAPDFLELPIDYPRPQQFLGNGATEEILLPKHLSASLKELALSLATTLSTLFLAVFQVFLHRYSGKSDIIIGTPYAYRSRPEFDSLIGYFLQMFIIRSECSSHLSFTSHLANVSHAMTNCYKNADIPFEWIVNALNPSRNPSFHPIFQVLFVYENITKSPLCFGDAKLLAIPCVTRTAKFDLSLFIFDSEEGITCKLEYCTDLFTKETSQRMLNSFQTLLNSVAQNPTEKIGFLSILSTNEQNLFLKKLKPKYPRHSAIPVLFEEIAKKNPKKVALRYEGKITTYQLLNEKANRLGFALQKKGVKKNDFVGLYLKASDDLIVAILAILKLGAAYVPIDETYPLERRQYMIEQSKIKLMIDQSLFNELCEDQNSTSNLNIPIDPLDICHINYTSGSTGKPKGVEYTHLGVIRLLKKPTWMKIGPNDRMLQISNLSFDMLAAETWGALLNGATLCIYPQKKFSASELGHFIVQEKISHLFLSARLFVLMIEEALSYLNNVRFLGSTGEAMSAVSASVAYQHLSSCHILNAYGPTENHITTTYTVQSELHNVPIGKAVPGTEVYVLDSNQQMVPVGVYGELYIGGDGLAKGYLFDAEKTNEKFIHNPFGEGKLYKSGDIVRFRADGNLEYFGRLDTQVKILGFRIELGEIEEVIREHPCVTDCVARAEGDTIVAYIEKKKDKDLSILDIRTYTSEKLPKYSMPSFFILLEKFPITPNGKIDINALPKKRQIAKTHFHSPTTHNEMILSQIWSHLLKRPQISRSDDFFHLGGHSILAMQLHSQVRKKLNVNVPVSLIFEESTLEKYAQKIDQLQKGNFSTSKAPFSTWCEQEAILDAAIQGKKVPKATFEQYLHPKNIFLTGSTGFVGAFFLKKLLQNTKANIFCLSRGKTQEEALSRIINTLKKYSLWNPTYRKRIIAVNGDLEKIHLNLKEEEFQKLAREIDSIFHIGAFVNHAMSYEKHKMANVFGTQEMIRLASMHHLKPLHFISTVAVLDAIQKMPISEDADIENSKDISNGYVQSKWVAEKLILMARKRGIPCNIFRLPRVSGDSKIGSGPTEDFLFRLIQISLLLKKAPDLNLYDDLTPVDFICETMHLISKDPQWINSQFHVINPRPTLYKTLFKYLKKFGYSLTLIEATEWQKMLVNQAKTTHDKRYQALASLLADVDFSKPIKILPLSDDHVKKALRKEKIKCPKIDEKLFKKYINYYRKIGFL
ncbi:MAG TPA: amino acid adenylation domain-containing protein [Chlamydiales bacterium]|nr:amino acid adenylation domain-containing protein [Chlamydiales bacterium]